jgi:hypothetical protein
VLASGVARGASTAVVTSIAGAAVVAGGVAGITATSPGTAAQHPSSTTQQAGSITQYADAPTQDATAQTVAGMTPPGVPNDPAVTVASAPSLTAPPSPLSVTTMPAATPTADGGDSTTAPPRNSTVAHRVLPALPIPSARPLPIPALTDPPLPVDVPLASALPTTVTEPIESLVTPPIAAAVSALPILGFLGQ